MRHSWTSREAPRYRCYESTSNIDYSVPQRNYPPYEEPDPWHSRPPRHYSHSSYGDAAAIVSAQRQCDFTTINSIEQTSDNQDHSFDASNISHDANANDVARPKAKMVFPCVLYQMLQDADDKGQEDIVSWVSQGRAFRVHNTEKFVSNILPKYFSQTKITSFQRQLNMYCFVRITTGQDKGAYYHRHFVRGEPQQCDKIVRMPFKGKKGKTYSTHESDPVVYTGDVVDTSMTRQEPAQANLDSNADMVHSDHVIWHEPQQPEQYSDAYTVDLRYAWGTHTGDHLETSVLRQESKYPVNFGNDKMDNSEHETMREPKQPDKYHYRKKTETKYAWKTHTRDNRDTSMMISKSMSSIIHSNTDTTNLGHMQEPLHPVQYHDAKGTKSKYTWKTHTRDHMDSSVMLTKASSIIHSTKDKNNSGHITVQEPLHPVQYHIAKKTEAKYARRAHSRDYMDISTEPQEPKNSINYCNTELEKSRQNILHPVQYPNVKTAASTYARSTPFTDDNVSQPLRMNDRHRVILPKAHHYYHGTETKIPTPNQSLSYTLSKEDEVSSFCSADW
jgi:hypothetical protein